MQNPTDSGSEETDRLRSSSSSTPAPSGSNPPLVIVSERGRHSDESRRIVRAQAARASAAQSRVTRARNREEREGVVREDPASELGEPSQSLESPSGETASSPTTEFGRRPLVIWLSSILNTSVTNLVEDANAITPASPAGTATAPGTRGFATTFSAILSPGTSTGDHRPQLPPAVPPGITQLQQRIRISDNFVTLMGRTSFFDLHSPGIQERLHQLLFDLIVGYASGSNNPLTSPSSHPIQEYLRIACVCLTVFQGLRADGAVLAYQDRYERGLVEAWGEAMLLDRDALREPKAAEASLWAIFIITVTTAANIDTFVPLLRELLQDLQLDNWQQVRSTLLEFIFPVSFLDEPSRAVYNRIQQ